MGIFDRAKEALGNHPGQVDAAIDRSASAPDRRVGDKDDERSGPGTARTQDQRSGHAGADRPASPPPA